ANSGRNRFPRVTESLSGAWGWTGHISSSPSGGVLSSCGSAGCWGEEPRTGPPGSSTGCEGVDAKTGRLKTARKKTSTRFLLMASPHCSLPPGGVEGTTAGPSWEGISFSGAGENTPSESPMTVQNSLRWPLHDLARNGGVLIVSVHSAQAVIAVSDDH